MAQAENGPDASMAGVVDRIRRRNRLQQPQRDWTSTGSFINKPSRGWLHPDDQLTPDAGVCYGVRYIGCMVVKQSMKTLDFDTRTAVAKESISRVCEASGMKNASKKPKRNAKITKLLGEEPSLAFAGSNVNLTITTEALTLMVMETGEVIATHQMPGISFASGGDPDTLDFVAYVAKDEVNGRACFVLECGGGLAQDVITTIGQAFEIRFKMYLANQPTAINLPDSDSFGETDAWGNEEDYYNDRPGAKPPSPTPGELPPEYSAPKNNLPVSDGMYSSVKEQEPKVGLLIDFDSDPVTFDNQHSAFDNQHSEVMYDNSKNEQGAVGGVSAADPFYNNTPQADGFYDHEAGAVGGTGVSVKSNSFNDTFDMKPFNAALSTKKPNINPYHEEWFHGPLTREQTEELLKRDGDFLVRESTKSPGQFVLSGMHFSRIRHLLLVDPEGVVRTRDRTFHSVSHLINYHMENQLPIISQESELILKRPIIHSGC